MQLLRVDEQTAVDSLPHGLVVCHDVRNPAVRSEVLVRKGDPVEVDRVRDLLARGVGELHLAAPAADDSAEDEAAARLAAAVRGDGVAVGKAHFGQTVLTSVERGLLQVNAALVQRANAHEGVLVVTAEPDRPVDAGTTIGVVKCAPLFLPESTLLGVESLATTGGPGVTVRPFAPMRVALLAPGDRLRGGAFERSRAALAHAVDWFGSSLEVVIAAEATTQALAAAYGQAVAAGCQLIFAAGASGTDPLDIVFDGLRAAGGTVQQIGVPLEPGTACWFGSVSGSAVLGLASCELFGRPGALDLVLPRLFTGEVLSPSFFRNLAVGGLLLGPSRIAPFHTHEA